MTNIQNIFIFLNYASIFVMVVSLIILIRQTPSEMQKLALVSTFSLIVCCLGYLFRSEGQTVEELILGQKLVYSFNAFGMYFVLLFILEYCGYKLNTTIKFIFQVLNGLLTFAVLTLNYHPYFYKTYWLVNNNGLLDLEKEYGFLHTVAVGLFALYMAATVVVTIIYSINNSKLRRRNVLQLALAVAIPCGAYIASKVFDFKNDILPVAFAAFTVMILILIYKNKLYDVDNLAANYSIQSFDEGIIVLDRNNLFKGCNQLAKDLFSELKTISIDEPIKGASKVLDNLLSGNYKDYKFNDKIYGITISPVNDDDNVTIGKVVRLKNVTIERNYTQLLQTEKQNLESRVNILANISYKDELTDCYNRRYYEEELNEIRNNKSLRNITVWSIDINGLKETNDELGHSAGDEIIKATSNILKDIFNGYGKVFRTGGDEFYVITKDEGIDNKKMLNKIEKTTSMWVGKIAKSLSVSCGYIECNDCLEKTIDEVTILADKQMYISKREYYKNSGKDRRRSHDFQI